MKIGIIGAGNIGGTLARGLTALGHRVSIANSRGPASLAAVASQTHSRAVEVEEAVKHVRLVIVAVPEKSVPKLPKGLFQDVLSDVVIIDTGNYYPQRDGRIDSIESGKTESGWVADTLDRPVVKVFNNIMAHSLADGGRPKGRTDRIALPVAGDDAHAKALVIGLVDALGFDAVDASGIHESWRQQPGTPVYCTDLNAAGVRSALARADRAKAPQLRELSMAKMQQHAGATPRELVRLVRELHGLPSDSARPAVTREHILELLTEAEVAKVSRAEAAPRLIEGDEYVDLADLKAGLQQVQATPRTLAKNALPRSAVSQTSWSRILNALG